MTLSINGTRGFNWDDLLNIDAAWIREGLQQVKSLKKMVILLSDADVEKELVVRFEANLKQCFLTAEVRNEAPPPPEPQPKERRTGFFARNL